ncbi:MAG: glutaminyl-peptide cyclotransferase [Acidobacteriota bacterium]|nr:glutaminyl-peptide cyclotransferase [Acidobacteriota bacterium]MDH3524869.1 glutaminyl-peptide cyclotransferase [Acidobacteriota bacterium]
MARPGPLRALLALFVVLCAMLLAARCRAAEPGRPARLRARVLRVLPHDPAAYTQGLLWHRGELYESTGQYGSSRLRRVALETGEVLRERRLADSVFGEGLARVGDRLIQLSWQSRRGWVWDLETFEELGQVTYDSEGWGLCHDGSRLWMSDGSDRLVSRDPGTFAALGELAVTFEGRPVPQLNELECAEGWIYANVYGTDQIVRIDPVTGAVTALIDASGLLAAEERESADVLNGIAYDPDRELFYLTGKLWPRLFEVVFE